MPRQRNVSLTLAQLATRFCLLEPAEPLKQTRAQKVNTERTLPFFSWVGGNQMYLYVVTAGACGAVWDGAFKNKHFICLSGLTVLPRRAMGQLGDGGGRGRAACGERVWITACDSCGCCFSVSVRHVCFLRLAQIFIC